MAKTLGPTSIGVRLADGSVEDFSVTFSFEEPEIYTFDDGDVGSSYSGSTQMTSSVGSNTLRLTAVNELQLVALLIKITCTWVVSVCGPDAQIVKATGEIAANPLDAFS